MSDSPRSSHRSSRSGNRPTRRAAGVRASGPSSANASGSDGSKGTSRTGRNAAGAGAAGAGAAGASAKGAAGRKSAGTSTTGKSTARKSTAGARSGSASKSSAAQGSAAQRRTKDRKGKAAAGAGGASNFLNYPRAGKKNPWRWIPSFRLLASAFALLVLLGVGGAVWIYATTDVPEPDQVALAQTSTVYFNDGKTELGQFSSVNRKILPTDEIPQNMKDAVVASEDSTFYENRGVSPKGVVRAFVNNLGGGAQQGGSTITQQYVERYYTGTTTSYAGKVREMVMALKIDQELPKDEILGRYLNTIYFGRGAYGVQAAAEAYFDKDASELTDAESALLVAVIPAPSSYDPANNPKKSAQLWDRVIEREVNATGTLSAKKADELEFPDTAKPKSGNVLGGPHGYLLMMVRSEMKKQGFTEDQINTGGYTIVSTYDPDVQKNVEQAIKDLPDDRPKQNHVGIATVDPSTGAVRGMYGGEDYVEQPRNDATESRMQAGSIFKTFTLIAALKNGYSLNSTFDGNSPKQFPGWEVSNFGHTSYGQISLRNATTDSVNTAYAQLNVEIGPQKTMDTAIQLGLPKSTPGLDAEASNVLGSASPTVLEMAGVYSTVAAQGVHHSTHTIKTVKKPDGSNAFKHQDSSERVIDKDVAINATVALQGPPTEGSARYVGQNMNGRQVAGKTGTSSAFKSAWFVGFTPQLVTAVGMFQPSEDGRVEHELDSFGGVESMTGGQWPARIWVGVMQPTLQNQEMLRFPSAVVLNNQRTSDSDRETASSQSEAARRTTTQAPPATTQQPTTEKPTTEEPTTEEPTTEEPTTEEPTSDKPTSDKPTSDKPTSDKPKPTNTTKPTKTTKPPKDKPTSDKPPAGDKDAGKPTEGPDDADR